MRKLLIIISILASLSMPVYALDYSAPPAPAGVEKYMPGESISFATDLWHIVKNLLREAAPGFSEAISICASVIAIQLLIAVLHSFSGNAKKTVILSGVIVLSALLLKPSSALINLGTDTVQAISEYMKLLLPIMTAALAAQGGTATSTALYAGTVVLDTLLSILVSQIILPLLFIYIALGIAHAAIEEQILSNLLDLVKWIITWLLKITIYIFTGYMGITGVISGTVDASTLKATKLAVSNAVPVIGNIISDASEAILVGTGVVKNATGIYGALVIITMWLGPFLRVGIQYLLLKITAGISTLYSDKRTVSVVNHLASAMGYVLAMTSTVCLLLLISIVCFMKGMN